MKIQIDHINSRRRERGLATFFYIALLGIMVILAAANVRMVLQVGDEEKLTEQKQFQRLNAQTNAVATVESSAAPESK